MISESIIPKRIDFTTDLKNNEQIIKNHVSGSNVLVIGGAGTIGSNYIKKILKFKPKNLTVVDINENGLTELTRDLRSSNLLDYNPGYITYPVNLLSKTFDKIYNTYEWHLVANFSAHKHVRSEKDIISVEALIMNNIFGAIKLLNLCETKPPKYFFSVSTDKAANPVNIMGASKSLMEKLILSKKNKFRVSTARFANVAFSNGSLLEGFLNRIIKKQPLSCPSDIKRFFVTPEQSGEICLLSTFLGESGNIFFPKLDFNKDQIFFKEIALEFLKKNNFTPHITSSEKEAKSFKINNNDKRYPIYFFKTDTSGEKAYEEFYTDEEDFHIDDFDSLGYIKVPHIKLSFQQVINDFDDIFSKKNCSKTEIVNIIKKYVPDFSHVDTGNHLDQKM